MQGEFAQQDVVNSEQPDAEVPGGADLGEADIGDSGRVLVDEPAHARCAAARRSSYEMSQRRSLEFGANFTDVSYRPCRSPARRSTTRTADLTAGLVMRVSPTRLADHAGARRALRHRDSGRLDSSYGVELQWDTRTATGLADFPARRRAERRASQTARTETAWLAGAGVSLPIGPQPAVRRPVAQRRSVVGRHRDHARPVAPALDARHDAAARLPGRRARHARRGRRSDDHAYRPRSYATGDIGLQWHWQEEFSLRVTYDYTWQEFDDSLTDAATSSGAMISVLYQPLQRRR